MNRSLIVRFTTASLLLASSSAFAQILLTPGETHRLTLPSGHVTNELAIDVPANARKLHITANGPANSDIDLLLRYDGAFPQAPKISVAANGCTNMRTTCPRALVTRSASPSRATTSSRCVKAAGTYH